MYNFSYFKENDPVVVKEFMKANSFALIAGCDKYNQPVATQVPLMLEEREGKLFLLGHIQRKTDHHLAFEHNPNTLCVFTGPHTYVSASWYDNKQVASTWNYASVHAKGTLKFLDDAGLHALLTRLTSHYENNPHSPALVENMPEEYVSKLMKAIIAFEIEVTHLDNVFKLSQNHKKENFTSIVDHLKEQGGEAAEVAAQMEQRKDQLFPKTGNWELGLPI